MTSKFPLALGSGASGTWGPTTCPTMLTHDQVLSETKKPPFAFEGERGWYPSVHPSRPRRTSPVTLHAWVFWLPFRPTLRAFSEEFLHWSLADFVNGYSCGAAPVFHRLPTKHVGYSSQLIDSKRNDSRTVSSMSNVFSRKWGAGVFCQR